MIRNAQPELAACAAQVAPSRILVIDDDVDHAEVLAYRLARVGFDPVLAYCGRDGLRQARTCRPALIVLDLRLPDLHGFEVCATLSDESHTCMTPIVVLSGMEGPDIVRRCRAAGGRFFLKKPYDPDTLLAVIRQALAE